MQIGTDFIIRRAEKEDAIALITLIKELAAFERAPEEVINTATRIEKEGFGTNPLFHAFVAEIEGQIIGMSLSYYRYSTWKGKCLYLEDLIVTSSCRGQGIGKALFEETIKFAKQEGCSRMSWQVLDWNRPALDFYKKYGSEFESGWLNSFIDLKHT